MLSGSTPLAFLRVFLGRCYCKDKHERLEIYRDFFGSHLVAFQHRDGRWHIRRKYRRIYSKKFIKKVAEDFHPIAPPEG